MKIVVKVHKRKHKAHNRGDQRIEEENFVTGNIKEKKKTEHIGRELSLKGGIS